MTNPEEPRTPEERDTLPLHSMQYFSGSRQVYSGLYKRMDVQKP